MKKNGFSLVEMLLVLVFITVGFLPLMLLFSNGIVTSSNTSKSSQALELAQQTLEELKNTSWSNIVDSSNDKGTIAGYPAFSRSVSAAEPNTNLKDVIVLISWQTGTVSDSLSIETYFANY
jgi:Tfp pilus assembly protein PilV